MDVERIELAVVGHEPRPWGVGESQWTWRAALAEAARKACASAGRPSPLVSDDPEVPGLEVEIVFRMSPARFLDADLDNLAKPVLDTLFRAKHVFAPASAGDVSGVLFGFDDSRVVKLTLEKRRVESIEVAGIDVVVGSIAFTNGIGSRSEPQ